jgi:hypothetical protein
VQPAHGWGPAIQELGHEVRLIPLIYVKPFIFIPTAQMPPSRVC